MNAMLMDKDHKLLLRFARSRTIKLSESEESRSEDERRHQLDSSQESHGEEKDKIDYPNTMKDFFKKSVLE